MANRSYLSGPHRLLPSYTPLATSRNGAGTGSNSRLSLPELGYNAYSRSNTGGAGIAQDGTNYSRAPPSPASSALNITYPNVNEFPYGLSGVQMPTYNFGSELYNYVSNGFPRKSRMCTFCNKVFTRSTTRRYHERRCPLLRASNSLAKSEENSAAAAAAALKEQQRLKETANAVSNQAQSAPISINTNTISSQLGSNLLSAPTPASSPPTSLHPAYPSHYAPALGSSPSRGVTSAYSYAHTYGTHFYNSISAAALASLDQNSNSLQPKKELDSKSWTSSPSPTSKPRDMTSTSNNLLGSISAMAKTFIPNPGVDLTARHCSDFNIRSQLIVFPPSSLRDLKRSPSPEPGERRSGSPTVLDRGESNSPQDFIHRDREWASPEREKNECDNKISVAKIAVANLSGARLKTSPLPILWNKKTRLERAQEQYMKIQSLDEDEEEEDDEEEDEDEVEEDEEQFNENPKGYGEISDTHKKTGENNISTSHNSTAYNPLVCQFCNKSFSDTITKQAHEALHSQTKTFGCCLCTHAFHCAYSLRIHILRHHNEGPYTCKQCSRGFDEIMELKSHLLTQHSLTKQESCSLKYFSLLDNSNCSSNLPQLGVSDSEQDWKEKNRPTQRRSADSLPSVLKDTDPATKSIDTNELEKQFASGDDINDVTEVCKICNKTFARSFIRFHERSHADQKPYECPICNKRFGYKNNMKSHMKLHQGLKPYQCQICGARFTRGSTLRRHGRRHKISRTSVLDYVLYDQQTTPARSSSNNNLVTATGAVSIATTAVSHVTAATTNIAEALSNSKHSRVDQQMNKSFGYMSHGRSPLHQSTPNNEEERYNATGRRTPPRTSPISSSTPRMSSNFLTTQAMNSPLVGGLAAVAAANLFAYPAAAAPHLYQFYASTNQLMSYPNYTQNHSNPQAVQSDALNLSLGKRKSSYVEDDRRFKFQHKDQANNIQMKEPYGNTGCQNKIDLDEPGELITGCKIFAQHFKKEMILDNEISDHDKGTLDSKEALKISTEDFAAQVNMCCPSPLVQSSTSCLQHHSSAGSPVGSSSCNDSNIQAHASPSGISHHSSPANSAPSPSNLSENHLQELLLSLLTSGKMFRCSFCDIYFTEYAMFRLHQKYHQSDMSRPFLCSVCGEDCKDKTYFTVHLSEHLGLTSKTGLA